MPAANGSSAPIPWPQGLFSQEMRTKVSSARVLAVGAGGIGCELLKTLVMSGFRNIEVIDLDTIDVSNLNRQFLFRKKHVGQSKATVAAEAVKRFRPDLNIIAHQGNVKEPHYGADYFRKFDIVLNGLDNLDARRHVNRMCIAAGVPLVESGTAGYLGQVSVHVSGKVECFDCQPKPTPKTFPVCTIRTFPEKPVHCVVWAKELLFPGLFGEAEGEGESDIGGTDGGLGKKEGETAVEFAARVFQEVFSTKISSVLDDTALNPDEDVWQGRRPPIPLNLEALKSGAPAADTAVVGTACSALGLDNVNAAWTPEQSAAVFLEAIRRMIEDRTDEVGYLAFDKDDDLAMEFVAAAANLRSLCYHIPPQSLFDTKGMAGNIIHAIATTNAIISGLIVIETLKLIASSGDPEACRATYLRQDLSNKKLVTPTILEPPNPKCMACGLTRLELRMDTTASTFGDLVTKILRGHLGFSEFSVFISNSIIYEESEDLEEDEIKMYSRQLPKKLEELPAGGIANSSFITVRDEMNGSRDITVLVCHQDTWEEETHPERFLVIGEIPKAPAGGEQPAQVQAEEEEAVVDHGKPTVLEAADGSFVLVDSEDEGMAIGGGGAVKRKRGEKVEEEEEGGGGGGKRAKDDGDDDDVIELLD